MYICVKHTDTHQILLLQVTKDERGRATKNTPEKKKDNVKQKLGKERESSREGDEREEDERGSRMKQGEKE